MCETSKKLSRITLPFLRMRLSLQLFFVPVFSLLARAEDHWAYLPPVNPGIEIREGQNPVDTILDQSRNEADVAPSALAPPENWVRRAAYTLTGLPPTPAQMERIKSDPSQASWRALIDEMLESPAYGERWARHWMDVARYADTRGYLVDMRDNRYPFAYTYRDWLINAFNKDLPYPEFIKLQIAADHLRTEDDHPDLAALGFLTTGPRAGKLETIDDRVDVVTRGFLSSTVSCARCHKHKFDPITMEDYYSLYSIFENTTEPDPGPVIGKPADQAAYEDFITKAEKIEKTIASNRMEIVNHLRNPDTLANYLDLAWLSKTQGWDTAKTSSEAFNRGRYRIKAVEAWTKFLNDNAWGRNAIPVLSSWATEMEQSPPEQRIKISRALADTWLSAETISRKGSPLELTTGNVNSIYDTEDRNKEGKLESSLSKLRIEHPGSPPRAMAVADAKKWEPARTFKRGNQFNPGDNFERQWLSFLGGGKFPGGKSPRLSLAEKIANPANPLTSRVMVNRVWAWHMGAPLADPGDFGLQQAPPKLLPLLDFLAIRFNESGGSLKDLHRLILTSEAFRLTSEGSERNGQIDEANSLFWKWNLRRADFESMRDRLLATSGSLDLQNTGGHSVIIDKPAADSRRSLYSFIDRYALATTFVSFDLPHPDHHAPKRIETTVPQQALFLLNSPLLIRQAEQLSKHPEFISLPDAASKIAWLFNRIYKRQPTGAEARSLAKWISQAHPADYAPRLSGTWEVRYARVIDGKIMEAMPFPLLKDNSWRTGPELANAPVRWLHVGQDGGHAGADHAAIIRWRALGSGEVRLVGNLKRDQPQGDTLEWNLSHNGNPLENHQLPFKANATIGGKWTKVSAGDTIDFILRAPNGESYGGLNWAFRILGRESPGNEPVEINNFSKQFPRTNDPSPEIKPASPWADLIQMLWASNEFQFIN